MNPHLVTEQFETALATYTGAKFAIAIDNCSNALFLCLKYLYHIFSPVTFRFDL